MLCLWLSILGGVNVHFTEEPSNPSYFNNGSDANLVWDYTDPHYNIQSTIYSVLIHSVFIKMMVNDSHGVQEHPKRIKYILLFTLLFLIGKKSKSYCFTILAPTTGLLCYT